MKPEKTNYVNEEDLKEDVRILYETGEFPERFTQGLMKMVDGILHSRRFCFYTPDWKEEMKGNALAALVTTLSEKRFDLNKPNAKFFSWATKVIFNQFYNTIETKKRDNRHKQKLVEDMTK